MNKYQEAINDIDGVKMLIKVVLVECEFIEDLYNEELDTLRKLLDKATPKKVIRNTYNECPNCSEHFTDANDYCQYCSQALDWSEE